MTPTADNGLSLQQHVLLLVVSVVVSVVLHFGVLYFWGEHSVARSAAPHTSPRSEEQYPVVHIETFLKETHLLPPEASPEPSAEAAAEAVAEALPERAQSIAAEKPTLTPAPLPDWSEEPVGVATAPEAPILPKEALVRQEVAVMAESAPPAETYWTVNAEVPRVPVAPLDLASTATLTKGTSLGAFQPPQTPVAAPAEETFSLQRLPEIEEALTPEPETFSVAEDMAAAPSIEMVAEKDQPVVREIDHRLGFALSVYAPEGDAYRYFRLDIQRRNSAELPVMEKDVVFIQDVSGSIGKGRLERCKRALKAALFNTLRLGDRFNVFAFRDQTLTPMATWTTFSNVSKLKAETFIDSLRATGSTNLFLLLNDLRSLPLDPKRPMIAVVITDGEPTSGVVETTRIISEFARVNGGEISVYAFGARKTDPYFLDMLCYTNRGENTMIQGDPSKIDAELTPVFSSIRNPVMKDLQLTLDTASQGEVHPRYLTPLYADRPLTLYGRVPKATVKATCRLSGSSSSTPYDAVFTLNFDVASKTKTNLRKAWAERAMFDLLAEYAANPSPTLERKIQSFSKTYGVPNPYRQE